MRTVANVRLAPPQSDYNFFAGRPAIRKLPFSRSDDSAYPSSFFSPHKAPLSLLQIQKIVHRRLLSVLGKLNSVFFLLFFTCPLCNRKFFARNCKLIPMFSILNSIYTPHNSRLLYFRFYLHSFWESRTFFVRIIIVSVALKPRSKDSTSEGLCFPSNKKGGARSICPMTHEYHSPDKESVYPQ